MNLEDRIAALEKEAAATDNRTLALYLSLTALVWTLYGKGRIDPADIAQAKDLALTRVAQWRAAGHGSAAEIRTTEEIEQIFSMMPPLKKTPP